MVKVKKLVSTNLNDDSRVSPTRCHALKLAAIIGSNIRAKRISYGLTQSELGDLMNLSYQQIQKFEAGKNVISSVQLYDVSLCFKTPISYFYHGLQSITDEKIHVSNQDISGDLSLREVSGIVRCFSGVENKKLRKQLIDTIQTIGQISKS